jgi:beta-phosphoglucomutase
MLEAIVFDFDGVVADTEPLHYRAFMRILEPLGRGFDYACYLRDYIGCDDRDAFRLAFAPKSLSDSELADLIRRKSAAFEAVVAEGVTFYPGVIELINEAASALPLAICSGALRSDIDLIMSDVGDGSMLDRFAAIVTAEDVAKSKPDPASYVLAAERLGVAPANCLAIEDTPAGLASAQAAGMKTLGVATTHDITALFADRIESDLASVTLSQLQDWWHLRFEVD